jgi:iron(III) transport system permease protein
MPASRAELPVPRPCHWAGSSLARRPAAGTPVGPALLRVGAVLVAVAFALPAAYVLWRAASLGSDLGELVDEAGAPLWRTVQLAVLVSASTAVLGTGLAWLLVRTDVPLARLWRALAPLPLVFPSFVGAAAFLAGLAPDGVLREALALVGYDAPRRFRGLGASWLVLTLFTYPYVYLPVAARLAALPPSLEESARLLGDGPRRMFRRVVLPAARSSILGGTLLVFLYSLSEFGAVQLLGYDTLTRLVYATRLVDQAQSFAAATLLLVMAAAAVLVERRLRGGGVRTAAAARRARPVALGRWRLPALGLVLAVLALALVVPVLSLGQWAWRGFGHDPRPLSAFGDELGALGGPAWTTAWLGLVAGALAVAVVLPAALLTARRRTRLAPVLDVAVLAGFAVPGLVIALSLAFWSLRVEPFDRLYQTAPLLIVAYVVHFGSQALRSAEVAVGAVPGRLAESARLLGAAPWRRALTVHLPLMRPGLLAGGGLVLLSTVKELPATLLLAPTGTETLATRVWSSFEEGFLAEAGLAALVLLAVSGVLTWLFVLRRASHLA